MLYIFDTNVLLSAILFPNSLPNQALEKAYKLETLIFSKDTHSECLEVLSRSKFDKYVSEEKRLRRFENLKREILDVPISQRPPICRDPKDEKFLTLASFTKPNCIISGDKDLLALDPFQEISILTPNQFLDTIEVE